MEVETGTGYNLAARQEINHNSGNAIRGICVLARRPPEICQMVMFDDPRLRLVAESSAIPTEDKVKFIVAEVGERLGPARPPPSSTGGIVLRKALKLLLNSRLLAALHQIHHALKHRKKLRAFDASEFDPTP